ncbi:Hypothetical_protein [Hexamita inflata]|uniref:Hypothetical_protein n=1 Tax=Hexamita inflata TaxID=28002 RepID=A0AA86QKH8_9EUKA|nr:Hypothetical protein HINF_LOCUS45807 [Hexamita inflata]
MNSTQSAEVQLQDIIKMAQQPLSRQFLKSYISSLSDAQFQAFFVENPHAFIQITNSLDVTPAKYRFVRPSRGLSVNLFPQLQLNPQQSISMSTSHKIDSNLQRFTRQLFMEHLISFINSLPLQKSQYLIDLNPNQFGYLFSQLQSCTYTPNFTSFVNIINNNVKPGEQTKKLQPFNCWNLQTPVKTEQFFIFVQEELLNKVKIIDYPSVQTMLTQLKGYQLKNYLDVENKAVNAFLLFLATKFNVLEQLEHKQKTLLCSQLNTEYISEFTEDQIIQITNVMKNDSQLQRHLNEIKIQYGMQRIHEICTQE